MKSRILFVPLYLTLLLTQIATGQPPVQAGLDAWLTPLGSTVQLPPFPQDFPLFGDINGVGNDPIPMMPMFPLQSHPFDNNDPRGVFAPPPAIPIEFAELEVEFFDQHGNEVGADSRHAMSSTLKIIPPEINPYPFDTLVERKQGFLPVLGQDELVDIQMRWLSLKSVDPIEVIYGAQGRKFYDVFVGLSDLPLAVGTIGRIRFTVDEVDFNFAGGNLLLGEMGDEIDLAFDMNQFDFFDLHPEALGLPVFYQVVFRNHNDPADVFAIDDPIGNLTGNQFKTVSVFHPAENTPGEWSVPVELGGDFNFDGAYTCDDIDVLTEEIAAGRNDPFFDLTQDGLVNLADRDAWLAIAGAINLETGAFLLGDANLDEVVDVSDFNVWNSNKFLSTAAWCLADFNADGNTDVSDFNIWNENKFSAAVRPGSVVPEPTGIVVALTLTLVFLPPMRSAHSSISLTR